jgi:hypothetical protein
VATVALGERGEQVGVWRTLSRAGGTLNATINAGERLSNDWITMNSQAATPQAVTDALVRAFCHEIIDSNGLLLLSTAQTRKEGLAVDCDPVGVESTMNKRYVTDLVGRAIDENARDVLMRLGRAIMHVWAERIALLFPGRDVVFYLGGSESVILRFHVRRTGMTDWTDLTDREYFAASNLEVYILYNGNLTRS